MNLPDARYMLYDFTPRQKERPTRKDGAINILAPLPALHILEKQFESIAQCSHIGV